jgi:putative acetyltransferase
MILIRPATLDDRAAIWAVHTSSIRLLCSKSYPASQIERWAGFLTPERYAAVITDGQRRFVVAEIAGRVVGFGQFNPSTAEVEAVYVHPEHAGAGVGGALLRHLEQLADAASLPSLHLTATLNAVPFYERHGFKVTGYGEHEHPSGAILRCAFMRKTREGAG